MHTSHRPYLGIALLLCSVLYTDHSGGVSQQPPLASSPQFQQTAKPTVPMLDEGKGLIHLDVSVTKSDGEPVFGLTREDFELLDEVFLKRFCRFTRAADSPPGPNRRCRSSCSLIRYAGATRPACRKRMSCVRKLELRHSWDRITVTPIDRFPFSEYQTTVCGPYPITIRRRENPLVSDLSSGNRIVLDRRPDALRALAYIATTERRKPGRKVMLWIGPGCGKGTGIFPVDHHAGQKSFEPIYWFTTLFREARMSIDEIPVDQEGPCTPGYQRYLAGPRTVHDANDRFLYKKVLAIQSGGSVANDANDLVAAMNRCLSALNFYALSFTPPVAVQLHEYHSLQVRVDKPGLVVHTNTGYYDEPFYSDQPNPAIQRVTVEQLNHLLSETNGREMDGRADKLSKLELTERLSLANSFRFDCGSPN